MKRWAHRVQHARVAVGAEAAGADGRSTRDTAGSHGRGIEATMTAHCVRIGCTGRSRVPLRLVRRVRVHGRRHRRHPDARRVVVQGEGQGVASRVAAVGQLEGVEDGGLARGGLHLLGPVKWATGVVHQKALLPHKLHQRNGEIVDRRSRRLHHHGGDRVADVVPLLLHFLFCAT